MVKKIIPILLLFSVFIAAEILASIIFASGSVPYYFVLILWPLLSLLVMFKFCFKGRDVLIPRMVHFFSLQILIIVIGAWFF
jgi:hypothetical protein